MLHFATAAAGYGQPPRRIPFWWRHWTSDLRKALDSRIAFNLLAFHAGAQWLPVLFDHKSYAGDRFTPEMWNHVSIVGMPNMPSDGLQTGGHNAIGRTLSGSRALWMYCGWFLVVADAWVDSAHFLGI